MLSNLLLRHTCEHTHILALAETRNRTALTKNTASQQPSLLLGNDCDDEAGDEAGDEDDIVDDNDMYYILMSNGNVLKETISFSKSLEYDCSM